MKHFVSVSNDYYYIILGKKYLNLSRKSTALLCLSDLL